MKIEGSVVLVTGANRGIGAEYVRQLLDRGASKVYASARNIESVTNDKAVAISLDVTSASDIAEAVKSCGDVYFPPKYSTMLFSVSYNLMLCN